MTGRERALAALQRRPPDRVPLFEKLVKSPHADAVLGRPCAFSNQEYRFERMADGAWDELVASMAVDLVDLCEALGFDLVPLYTTGPAPEEKPVRLRPGLWRWGGHEHEFLPNGWMVRRPLPPEQGGPVPVDPEAAEAQLLVELREGWEVVPPAEEHFTLFREVPRLLAARGLDLGFFAMAYAMVVAVYPPHLLSWFATRPPELELFCRRALEQILPLSARLAELGVHLVGIGGDVACDHGPIIAPAAYHDYVMPVMRAQAAFLRERGVHTSIASDGYTWPLLDDFLAATGADAFDEIDYAAGMRLDEIRARYPVCTIGNLDIRHVLTHGTPAQVREHVREVLRAGGGEEGGHILMSSNVIHEDVKLPLYLEALNTYRDWCGLERLSL